MAPSNKTGNNPNNSGMAVPGHFRCRVGGEWLPASSFSGAQLAKWRKKKRIPNDGITAETIGLTCLDHAGQPSVLLKCEGPCGLWKAKDKFSAAQRRNKLHWCSGCVRWRSQQEYDSIPTPAPNEKGVNIAEYEGGSTNVFEPQEKLVQEIVKDESDDDESTDSENTHTEVAGAGSSGHYFGAGGGDDDDDDDDFYSDVEKFEYKPVRPRVAEEQNPAKPLSATVHEDSSDQAQKSAQPKSAQPGRPGNAVDNWVPPHLRAREQLRAPSSADTAGGANRSTSSTSSNKQTSGGFNPNAYGTPTPLSGSQLTEFEAGATSPFTGIQTSPFTGVQTSPFTGVQTNTTHQQSPFTGRFRAFDASGNPHMRTADHPESNGSSVARSSVAGRASRAYVDRGKGPSGGWARPDHRKKFNESVLETRRAGVDGIEIESDGSSEDEF